MKITGDEPKRLANLDKHQLDFADLDEEFFADAVIFPAKQERFLAIGWLGDFAVTVVFAGLGAEAVAVVSMRHSSSKERKLL